MADSDEPEDGVVVDPTRGYDAISPHSLLGKLSFVSGLDHAAEPRAALQAILIEFHKKERTAVISRAAIDHWFRQEKPTLPVGNNTHVFLKRYFESLDRNSLTSEQRKVHTQLSDYLRHFSVAEHQYKIRTTPAGHLQFQLGGRTPDLLANTHAILGTYFTYKMRFSEDRGRPIAREVLRVFRAKHDLRFEHWYVHQNNRVDRFEGSVLPVDNLLWFFGTAARGPERLRVMSLRRTDELHSHEDRYRWGLLQSDVPLSRSHEPAACRILLAAIQDVDDQEIAKFAKEQVRQITPDELPEANRAIILRLIDNQTSALSTPQSWEPASGPNGPILDGILKVDQVTMRAAISDWEGKIAFPDEASEDEDLD